MQHAGAMRPTARLCIRREDFRLAGGDRYLHILTLQVKANNVCMASTGAHVCAWSYCTAPVCMPNCQCSWLPVARRCYFTVDVPAKRQYPILVRLNTSGMVLV